MDYLRDAYRAEAENHELLRETITELQLQLEDEGWMRLSGWGVDQFSREALDKIAERSRVLYLKNPLVQRGANVKRLYVWGQGMSIHAEEPKINDVLQEFLTHRRNRLELTGHQARMDKEIELQVDGNLFFVLFVNQSTGFVQLASIPFKQMQKIICNPEDAKDPWLYLRQWTEDTSTLGQRYNLSVATPRKAYYPDWQYSPTSMRGRRIEDVEVRWEGLIYHVKVGAFSDWKWGVSEHYAAQDWAKAYKEFLEDWASITRSYRRFAFKVTGAKSKAEIANIKGKMDSTLGQTTSETQPPPLPGSVAVLRAERDLQPIRTAGATVSAEDGRRLLLMVAATEGLPETFFGDVSVGTLATATSLDRPTELAMTDRQTLWADIHMEILDFVLLQAVKATSGPLRSLGSYRREKINSQWQEWVEWNKNVDPTIDIDFPPLIEASKKDSVQAIVSGATLGGFQSAGTIPAEDLSRMILLALGADDIDEILETLYPENGEPPQTAEEAALAEAARVLRDGLERLIEKHAKAD